MRFSFVHNSIHVLDLDRSLAFYAEALGLREVRRREIRGKTFVYLSDGHSGQELEMIHVTDRTAPYDLGENEFHLAFSVDNFAAAHMLHEQMQCVCHENPEQEIYFISDPDGYWVEILPSDHTSLR